MAYLFRQKLNLEELASSAPRAKRVLIHERDEYLGALYRHYLRAHNFDVKHCPDLAALRQAISSFKPDALVFSADNPLPQAVLPIFALLPALALDFPGLRLISTGADIGPGRLGELMAAGVLSHINRKFSRPQDLVVIVKSVLQN